MLGRGQAPTRTLSNGGLMAHELERRSRVHLTGPEGTRLIVIRSRRGVPGIGHHESGRLVKAPGRGQRVWVLAAYPRSGEAEVTMRFVRPRRR